MKAVIFVFAYVLCGACAFPPTTEDPTLEKHEINPETEKCFADAVESWTKDHPVLKPENQQEELCPRTYAIEKALHKAVKQYDGINEEYKFWVVGVWKDSLMTLANGYAKCYQRIYENGDCAPKDFASICQMSLVYLQQNYCPKNAHKNLLGFDFESECHKVSDLCNKL